MCSAQCPDLSGVSDPVREKIAIACQSRFFLYFFTCLVCLCETAERRSVVQCHCWEYLHTAMAYSVDLLCKKMR